MLRRIIPYCPCIACLLFKSYHFLFFLPMPNRTLVRLGWPKKKQRSDHPRPRECWLTVVYSVVVPRIEARNPTQVRPHLFLCLALLHLVCRDSSPETPWTHFPVPGRIFFSIGTSDGLIDRGTTDNKSRIQ